MGCPPPAAGCRLAVVPVPLVVLVPVAVVGVVGPLLLVVVDIAAAVGIAADVGAEDNIVAAYTAPGTAVVESADGTALQLFAPSRVPSDVVVRFEAGSIVLVGGFVAALVAPNG